MFSPRPAQDISSWDVSNVEEFGFDYELLGAGELMRRWPQFRPGGSGRAIYQEESGIVDAGRANAVHAALARANGARILEETPVRAVRPTARAANGPRWRAQMVEGVGEDEGAATPPRR